jgi:hypothetical protein
MQAVVRVVAPEHDVVRDAAPKHTIYVVVVCRAPLERLVVRGVAPEHDVVRGTVPEHAVKHVVDGCMASSGSSEGRGACPYTLNEDFGTILSTG